MRIKNILYIAILLMVISCSPVKYIPTIQKDTVYISQRDTEVLRDSIYIYKDKIIREKGDTIYITETLTEYRDRWRDHEVHDTCYVDKIHTETVIQEIEKKLSLPQKFFLGLGKISLLVLVSLIIFIAYKLYKKYKLL